MADTVGCRAARDAALRGKQRTGDTMSLKMRQADDAVRAMLARRAEASRNGASGAVLADFDYRIASLNATHARSVGTFRLAAQVAK